MAYSLKFVDAAREDKSGIAARRSASAPQLSWRDVFEQWGDLKRLDRTDLVAPSNLLQGLVSKPWCMIPGANSAGNPAIQKEKMGSMKCL